MINQAERDLTPHKIVRLSATSSIHLEAFSLTNDPRNEYEKFYTVDKLGNHVWNGIPIRCEGLHLSMGLRNQCSPPNTTSENLKAAVVKVHAANKCQLCDKLNDTPNALVNPFFSAVM